MGLLLIIGLAALAYLYETQPQTEKKGGDEGETRIHPHSDVRGANDSGNQPRKRNSGNNRTGGVKRGAGGKFQASEPKPAAATPPAKPDDKAPASEEASAQ